MIIELKSGAIIIASEITYHNGYIMFLNDSLECEDSLSWDAILTIKEQKNAT